MGVHKFLSILVPEEPFGERSVRPFHDALVPVHLGSPASDRDLMLRKQLGDRTHKLASGVDLQQFWPT